MKRIFSFLFAIIALVGTTSIFTACQEDAPEINFTINVTVNNDFTEVVNAINNGAMKQEAAIAALTAAIEKMQGEQDAKLDAIVEAINTLATTLDAKLAIIEAAMKAQTLALETKLGLIEAAIKALPDYSDKLAAIETAIAALPNYSEQLGAIAAAIEALPDYTDQMGALETALEAIAANIEAQEGQYADELAALTEAIDAIKSEVAAGNKSQEDALAEIIALLESGAIAGGGSGSGSEGGEGDEGDEGESTEYILTLTTSRSIGQTIELVVNYQIKEAKGATLADGYPSKRLDGLWSYVYELTDQTVTVKFEGGVSYIDIQNQSITDVDLSKLSSLQSFICMNNQLTELDFSKNKKLHTVNCRNNQIQGENVTKLMNSLPDRNNEEIFARGTIKLCEYFGSSNMFTDKDIAIAVGKQWQVENAAGEAFPYITLKTKKTIGETITIRVMKGEVLIPACGVTQVSSEVTDSYYQTYTYKLTNQTVRVVGDPIYVAVSNNELNYFRVARGICKVERIDCSNNQLTELLLDGNNNLVNLDCSGNQLASLDARFNTKLMILLCSNNQLTELKLSKERATTGFKTLSCYKNKLDATAMTNIIDNLLDATDANAELNLKHSTGEGNVVTDAHITAAKDKKYKVFIHDGSGWKEQ